MLPGKRLKILFVINPISGGSGKQDMETTIRDYFSEQEADISFFLLDGKDDEINIGKELKSIMPDVVVAAGGDGTVSMVARQLLGTGIALGILPAGSANGMAKELGIPENITEALHIIAKDNRRDSDVIAINDRHICLHLSDIGLNARLIRNFEEGNLRGKWGYARQVLKTIWSKKHMRVNIRIGNEVSSHAALMVVLANASKYGTGAVINPHGDIYDGKFEVVIMRRLAISELLKMWFRPQPFNPAKIKMYPATSVDISTTKKVDFQVDGEYLGKVKSIQAKILPGQLTLLVP